MPNYASVLRSELTHHASRWFAVTKLVANLGGYAYATVLALSGAAAWQVASVASLSGALTLLLLYQSARSSWNKEQLAREDAEDRLKRLTTTGPLLRLREPGAVYVKKSVSFFALEQTSIGAIRRPFLVADFLQVAIINDPAYPSPTAEAKSVLATVEYFRGGQLLKELHGRWSQSTQPGERIANSETTMDLLRMDFGIGDARDLDIAMKVTDDEDAFMYCNDNYHYPSMKPPGFNLPPGAYRVRVRLRAVGVDQTFEWGFRHRGKGTTLEIE
jgi:hypothetical protein